MTDKPPRCGFVCVAGLPNAGKSTLVNALVGTKVSIVSRKVQTTRCRVLGIVQHKEAQLVMVDTPGIFRPEKPLEKAMVGAALEALSDADMVVHLVDATKKNAVRENEHILQKLSQDSPCILVLNKVDAVNKPDLLALSQGLNERFSYAATFMISALKGTGVEDLLDDLVMRLPEGPWLFDEDQITDMPLRLMAAEITREKIFDQLHQELPYAVLVETENWEDFKDGSLKIDQVVYVQKNSQKGIVLGKGGERVKKIGEAARLELEKFLERRVHLKIFVKVQENWAERQENYRLMGLDVSS